MEKTMDRRQRKSREAIFAAFTQLLSEKNYNQITVGEIIALADVGRATFYAHFPTRDFLLKELCRELFCHVLDSTREVPCDHRHIFHCEAPSSVFLHLFQHIQKNDNRLLDLFCGKNNDLFLQYFKTDLLSLVREQLSLFQTKEKVEFPLSFRIHHVAATFVETLRWWVDTGMKESPETVYRYFSQAALLGDLM